MREQHHAFIHVEDGIRLVDLKNEDEKYLKQNGFSKLPSCIQGVQFSCLGKYYQGFGFRNDIGGVEFFSSALYPVSCHLEKLCTNNPAQSEGKGVSGMLPVL